MRSGPSAPLLRAVLWTLLTRVGVLPLGLLQGVILARALQPAGLGLYSALLTDVNLTVTLLSLGLPGALAVLIGERATRLRRLLSLALLWGGGLIGVPALLLNLWAHALGPQGAAVAGARLPRDLALIALLVGVQYLRDVLNALLSGTQQFRAQNVQALVLSVLQLALCLFLWRSGALSPRAAVGIQLFGNLVQAALAAAALRVVAREHRMWRRPEDGEGAEDAGGPVTRRALATGLRNFLHIVPDLLLLRIDVYLIQRLLPGGVYQRQLGLYQAGVRIAELVLMVPGTLNGVLMAKAAAREDLTRVSVISAKLSLYLGGAALLGMALLGRPLLVLLYGPRYEGSFLPCLLVLLGCCTLCFSSPLAGTLAGAGAYPRSIIVAQVVGLIVNVLANLWLLPRYDIVGAAAASAGAYAVSAVVLSLAFARRFAVAPRQLLRPESPLSMLRELRKESGACAA